MMTRRGALDGLRAVALIAVLLYHSLPDAVPGGFLGVEVFFVLSGFLLTSILLAEHRRSGVVEWRRYAERRVRRLAPAMLAVLAGLVIVVPLVAADDAHRLTGDLFSALAGVTNWHLIADHSSYFEALGRPPLVRHLWSLAVEIQFYVLCPLLVAWLARRRKGTALATLGIGVAGSAAVMALLYTAGDPSRAYYGTDARVGAMLAGALLAVALAGRDFSDAAARPVPRLTRLGMAGVVILFVGAQQEARLLYPLGFLLTQAATVLLIVEALRPGPIANGLGRLPLRWLGERSYGIYLWHWPLVALLRPRIDVAWSPAVAAAVTISLAVVAGHLSYVLIERPFLRPPLPRRKLLVGIQYALTGVALGGLSVLVVDLPNTDPLVSSLRTGQQVVSLQREAPATTTTIAPAPPPDAAAAPATPPEPAPPPAPAVPAALAPGPPPGSVAVTSIGDSVMLGAAPQLQARLGGSGYIDAKVGRQYSDGVAVARALREQGRLGQVAIIHLGTNGPPHDRDIDALMGELASVPRVLFVTVRMPRDWEAQTNAVLRAGAGRHPKIVLVDWHDYANPHIDWFGSDGIHLKPTGAQAYADLMGSALAPA